MAPRRSGGSGWRFVALGGRVAAATAAALFVAGSASAQQSNVASADRAGPGADATADGGDTPTYYADVLPIVQEECASCHRPEGTNMGGMVAPFSLLSYEEARPWAPMVADAVRTGKMPPWSASAIHGGDFKNERRLEDHERETIIAWAEGGAPEGDADDAPPLPDELARMIDSESEWALGQPDLVLSFDEPYCLDDDLQDIYVDIPVQITEEMLPEDRWIESVEYRNGPAVHHIISSVGGLVPGMEPHLYEDGYGRLFRAGPREVMFNMHFNKQPGPGTALCTNIQAGITFKEPGEVIRHVTSGESLLIPGIRIPAGSDSYSASRTYTFEEDVEILSFMPHMHLRGTAALYELFYPDGRHRTLLHVPDYDFNWQHTYEFAEPVLAPAGSELRFTLWWDNSEQNPHNPDPTVEVTWGRPTTAEMSQGYMSVQRLEERHIVVGEEIPDDLADEAESQDEPEAVEPEPPNADQ